MTDLIERLENIDPADTPSLAKELATEAAREIERLRVAWKPMAEAPRDGTWILLRGRNMAGQPMVPVVAAFKPVGAAHHGDSWVDSRGFENCDSLAADQGADWHPLPTA